MKISAKQANLTLLPLLCSSHVVYEKMVGKNIN